MDEKACFYGECICKMLDTDLSGEKEAMEVMYFVQLANSLWKKKT